MDLGASQSRMRGAPHVRSAPSSRHGRSDHRGGDCRPGRGTGVRITQFGPLDSRGVTVAEQEEPAYFANARDGGQQFRVYTAPPLAGPGGGLVRTSRAANADDGALRSAALLLAGLTATAEHVTETRDLTARFDSTGTNDEVGRLGSSFATMLAALHDSLTAQRQLVADASHELRTPLTSLTTNLDLLQDGAGLADPQAPALVRAARPDIGHRSRPQASPTRTSPTSSNASTEDPPREACQAQGSD
jgi:signal transduction histidine kinase